jgi:GNAT superfamily N-acetyltransferase
MYHIIPIESATHQQLKQIIALYRDEKWWWDKTEHIEVAEKIISGSFCFLVAVCDDEIIGMGRAISDGVSDAYLQDVAVRKDMRGKGIGSALIRALIRRLKDSGIDWIGLIAERGSHHFYEKLGLFPMINAVPMLLTDNSLNP